MPDNPITCPSCGEVSPAGTKTCGFCTLPLISQSGRPLDDGTRIINDEFQPQSTVFTLGSLIADRYEVLRELGRGGMGAVYLVADEKMVRKEMALKIISPALVDSPEMRKRFVQEVLASQELFHENIIRVHHLDEYRGLQFLTMEYLPGRSLREVMTGRFDTGRFFSVDESAAVLSPVLSALAHAHARNVIHRDLKPENIIINGAFPDITVKVLDFGLARIMSSSRMTSSAVTMGTAYYMSPEQLSGRGEVDHRTDLFAGGVILYELLTGKIPAGRFKLPGELITELPEAVDDIVDKSLATNPDERFQDAKSFHHAVLSLSHSEAVAGIPEKREGVGKVQQKTAEIEDLGMTFVYIEPGTFMMGSPLNELQRFDDERQHRVILTRGYYIQTTPVTQGQWKTIMENNPSHFSNCGNSCPVENVSWNDAQEFISRLNQREGGSRYRLPTEAEWEYAARAGTTTPFFTGRCLSTNQSNYDGDYPLEGCPKGEYIGKTTPVKMFQANDWDLYDVHGNIWEWVTDWHGEYPISAITDPTGPSSGAGRVLRGGSWSYYARYCRSACRNWGNPGYRDSDRGFRLARHPDL